MKVLTALMLCLFIAWGWVEHPAQASGNGGYCEFTLHISMPVRGEAKSVTKVVESRAIRGKAWQAGKNVRMEMDMGANGKRIMLVTPTAVCTLDPNRKVALKQPLTAEVKDQALNGFPAMFLTEVNPSLRWKGARRAGTGRINGVPCTIWRAVLPGKLPQKLSLWLPRGRQSAVPLKAEVAAQMPGFSGGKFTENGGTARFTMTVNRSRRGQTVASSLFAVPAGYTLRTVPNVKRG